MTKFYEPWALLRDVDHAEVFKCSLQGIGNLKFAFNTNAPMLDIWSQNTLELTGLVAPSHSKSSIELNFMASFGFITGSFYKKNP